MEFASETIPVLDIPQNIRIGIAAGSIYKLTYENSKKEEYIGYSINLASRLQSYCRDIGLIFSGRLNINPMDLKKHSYVKTIATNINGFPKEYVLIDKTDYDNLPEETKVDLFE